MIRPGTPTPTAAQRPGPAGDKLNGRRVYTRADLMNRRGLGRATLERWYRDRADTGHPEPVATIGPALVWDAEAWDTWYAAMQDTDGLLDLDAIAARHRISRATAVRLWQDRDRNAHPTWVKRVGRTLFWRASDYDTWYGAYRSGLARPVAGSGRPGERVTLAEAARILGMAPTSITRYPRRPPQGWPEPVETEQLPSGRLRRWYARTDIERYARTLRTGGGHPPGPPAGRRWPYEGDPRLDVARQALHATPPAQHAGLAAQLAARHGGTPGTWSHILTAARQHPTDD